MAPALRRGVGLDDLQSSLPTQIIQGFYEKPHSGALVVQEAGDLLSYCSELILDVIGILYCAVSVLSETLEMNIPHGRKEELVWLRLMWVSFSGCFAG